MLGDLLRETREQKNLSLEDIEKGTNIRKLYIKAIEEGDYGKLPGEVFLKGFIKTYGKFLGLDGQKLIDQYKAEKAGIVPEPAKKVEDTTETKVEATSTTSAEKEQTKVNSTEEKEAPADDKTKEPEDNTSHTPKIDDFDSNKQYLETQSSGSKKNIFIIIIIIVVIIGGAIAYISSQSSSQAPAASQEQTSSQEAQPAQQEQQQQQPAPQSGSNVAATFSEDCWVEVKVDGKVVLSETVKAGTQLNWQGQQQVDITAGNAGAVDITFNGQPAGKMGNAGQVVTKSFTAPNAQQAQQQQPAQQPQQQAQPAAQNQAK